MPRRLIASVLLGFGLILITALTGQSDVVDPLDIQDDAVVPAGELAGSQTIGQTFVFHYPRLHAIQVRWIVSNDLAHANSSRIVFHLRRVDDSADLATAAIPLSDIRHNDLTRFTFPPVADSQNQSFYFFIDASRADITRGSISLWASGEDAYPDGAMNLAGLRTDRDLVFRAYYEPDLAFVLQSLRDLFAKYFSALVFVLLVPLVLGLAFLSFGRQTSDLHLMGTIALANGLGLAILSVGSFVLLTFGVSIEWLAAIVVLMAAGVGSLAFKPISIMLNGAKQLAKHPARPFASLRVTSGMHFHNSSLTLAALALVSVLVGLVQIHDLPAPLWVDSPPHAQWIQMIAESIRLPATAFYHLGYHTIAALLVRGSGISIPLVMLLLGQLLFTQSGLGIFLLSRRLSGSTVAGLASAVCVWFLSPTPAYWINWGRYPLLLGAALLPIALFWAIALIEQPRWNTRTFFCAAITCAGLSFAHFRLILFYLMFVTVYLVFGARRRRVVLRVGLVIGASALLGLMWLVTLFTHSVSAQDILAHNAGAQQIDISTAIGVAVSNHGPEVLVLAAIGAVIALMQRRRVVWIMLAWFVGLFAISALPPEMSGGGLIAPSFVILMGFFPAALLIGELANTAVPDASGIKTRFGFAAVIFILSLLGARTMASIINPATVLFTRADEQAMDWIKEHMPSDARFAVNAFHWFENWYVPSDGGGWIPYIANRPITFLDSSCAAASHDPVALARWIDAQQITHIYLGRRAGVLDKTTFACQPERYAPIYYQNGIAIFGVRRAEAQEEPSVRLPFDCGK